MCWVMQLHEPAVLYQMPIVIQFVLWFRCFDCLLKIFNKTNGSSRQVMAVVIVSLSLNRLFQNCLQGHGHLHISFLAMHSEERCYIT